PVETGDRSGRHLRRLELACDPACVWPGRLAGEGVPIPRDDLIAAALFVGLGAFFAIEALHYDLGTPFRMGPGFLPLTLGAVLVALGLAIGAQGVAKLAARTEPEPARETNDAVRDPVAYRAILLVSLAIAFFAVTLRGLGFV